MIYNTGGGGGVDRNSQIFHNDWVYFHHSRDFSTHNIRNKLILWTKVTLLKQLNINTRTFYIG